MLERTDTFTRHLVRRVHVICHIELHNPFLPLASLGSILRKGFSLALVRDELAIESNLPSDTSLTDVDYQASRHLGGSPRVVLTDPTRRLNFHPEFLQRKWRQHFKRADGDGLAGENAELGFGIDADANAYEHALVLQRPKRDGQLGRTAQASQLCTQYDRAAASLDGLFDAHFEFHVFAPACKLTSERIQLFQWGGPRTVQKNRPTV